MAHWTDKENWINKEPQNPQENIDKCGNYLTFDEMEALRQRTYKLNLSELEDLPHCIGLVLARLTNGDYLNKES